MIEDSQIAQIKEQITDKAMHAKQETIFDAIHQINDLHDQMQKKALEFVHGQARVESLSSGVSFCWIEMGSGGREERTLWTDQDNGLIYHDEQLLMDMRRISAEAIHLLSDLGYPLCQGGVMAGNPRWSHSFEGWKRLLANWGEELSLEHIRSLLIAADMRTLYGEEKWAEDLKRWLHKQVRPQITRLVQYSLNQPVPIGAFGQVFVARHGQHRGMHHIKEGGYYQLVSLVRALSIHAGIVKTSTLERISSLLKQGYLSHGEAAQLQEALAFFLYLRLTHHTELYQQGKPLDDFIFLSNMAKGSVKQLKMHLTAVKKQQNRWKKEFPRKGGENA